MRLVDSDRTRSEPATWLTSDPDEILAWAVTRNARPVLIPHSRHPLELGQVSLLFPGEDPRLVCHDISWRQWFELFETQRLCFVCRRREPDGSVSRDFQLQPRPVG